MSLKVSSELRRHYGEYYDGASEWRWLGALDKGANILALCTAVPHRAILEIGAGEGSVLKRLSQLSFADEMYALEISESGVAAIRSRNIERLVECSLFDGYCVPYPDKRFDLAILTHVIEHVEHPRKLLREAARVARYVFVEVPLEDTIRLKNDFVFDSLGHINSYSRKTFRHLVQSCGLKVNRQIVTNPSRAVYVHQSGAVGALKHFIRAGALATLPALAARIFTYHSALLCVPDSTASAQEALRGS
jgi:SAM-dependent methyltransferase